MTGRPGERRGNELWLRCPYCGDSQKDKNHAHYSVNTEGKFHCLRCGVGGHLSLRDLLTYVYADHRDFVAEVTHEIDWEDMLDEILPGAAYSRASALDRFHIDTLNQHYDVFLSRDTEGDIVGLALFDLTRKRRMVLGTKLFGWAGTALTSSVTTPLRLVEGPYDVMGTQDVCTYGLPSRNQLRRLQGHYVILCPDGDVWPDATKRRAILRLLDVTGPTILGIERLPDDKDPDEVPYKDRKFIPTKEVPKSWHAPTRLRNRMRSVTSSD